MDNASGAAVVWIKRDMIHTCYVLKYCKINREGKYTRVTCHGSLNLRGQGRVSADAMLLWHSSHTRGGCSSCPQIPKQATPVLRTSNLFYQRDRHLLLSLARQVFPINKLFKRLFILHEDHCMSYRINRSFRTGTLFYLTNTVCCSSQLLRRACGRSGEWTTLTE